MVSSIIHVFMAAPCLCVCSQIRRRRPTPATLFRVADQSSPEDDQSTHQVKVKSKLFLILNVSFALYFPATPHQQTSQRCVFIHLLCSL